jgi:hypothetical protein
VKAQTGNDADCVGHLLMDSYFQGTVDDVEYPGWIKLSPCFVKYDHPVNSGGGGGGGGGDPAPDLGARESFRQSPPTSPTGSRDGQA